MTVREIITSLEAEKKQLKEELHNLKEENKRLYSEIKILKDTLLKSPKPEVKVEDTPVSFEEPVVEEVHINPRSRRKKKVEPVEEPIENV